MGAHPRPDRLVNAHPLLLAFACCSALAAQSSRPASTPTVEEAWLRRTLGFLAAPEQEGRATGSAGFRRAAEFVAHHFQECGLEPFGDADGKGGRSWFQKLPWTLERPSAACGLGFAREGKPLPTWKPDSALRGKVQHAQEFHGPVVLLAVDDPDGAGISALDLSGKLVLVWLTDRGLGPENERGTPAAGARRFSILNELTAAKAAAHVIVDDAEFAALGGLAGSARPGRESGASPAERARLRMPNALTTTREHVVALVRACGIDLALPLAPKTFTVLPFVKTDLLVGTEVVEAPAWNVVARLPGRAGPLAAEHVVVGSHLDHLGTQQGQLHPGADDDASGTTGVLALAGAFSRLRTRPARSLVFVTFCGEELGLLGSAYFVEHSPVPLATIAAEVQMDMIGRNEEGPGEPASANVDSLHLIGTRKLSNDLHELCLATNLRGAGFTFEWDEEDVFFRSDHANFAKKGIPIAFLFTGFHPDYHRATDTPDRIEYGKLARVVRYAFDLTLALAETPNRPLVDPELWETTRRAFVGGEVPEVPAAPLRRAR